MVAVFRESQRRSLRRFTAWWPGVYRALDQDKLKAAPEADKLAVETVQAGAKKNALSTAAVFPVIMLACHVALLLHFKMRGGYKIEQWAKT